MPSSPNGYSGEAIFSGLNSEMQTLSGDLGLGLLDFGLHGART
jgi:hypothetical protein